MFGMGGSVGAPLGGDCMGGDCTVKRLGPARGGSSSSSSERVKSMTPSVAGSALPGLVGGRTLAGRVLARLLLGESSSSDDNTMTALRFTLTGEGDLIGGFTSGSCPFAFNQSSDPNLPSGVCQSPLLSTTTSSTSSSTRAWIDLKYLISEFIQDLPIDKQVLKFELPVAQRTQPFRMRHILLDPPRRVKAPLMSTEFRPHRSRHLHVRVWILERHSTRANLDIVVLVLQPFDYISEFMTDIPMARLVAASVVGNASTLRSSSSFDVHSTMTTWK